MIRVELDTREATAALKRLGDSARDPKPALRQIGEALVLTTRQRFASSQGPDGRPWAPNSQATYLKFLGGYKNSFGKSGRINKEGSGRAMGKRPLIGESKRLGTEIAYRVDGASVEVGSSLVYSAVQQFGARRGQFGSGRYRNRAGSFPIPWGDIPARPFLGVSEADSRLIEGIIERFLGDQVGA